MRKLLCVLQLSIYFIVSFAHPLRTEIMNKDSALYERLTFVPEMKEQEYEQKVKLFRNSLASYITTRHKEDLLAIQDSVVVNVVVNGNGRVDTVWLVPPKSFPFENMYRFIKSYDFKGPLIEYYTTELKQGSCLMKLKLVLDKKKMLHISFHYLSVKEERE